MTELELLKKRNQELEKLLIENGIIKEIETTIPTFSFSKIKMKELERVISIKLNFDNSIFNNWCNNDIILNDDVEPFLIKLLKKESQILKYYNE